MISIKKLQELTVFLRASEIDSIQLILHKEPPEVWVSKKVNRKFVLVGGTARTNPT